jgi:hypothetical protein
VPDGSGSTAAGTASTGMVHTEAARRGSGEEAACRGPVEEAVSTESASREPEEAAGGYMVIYRGTRYSPVPLLWGRG